MAKLISGDFKDLDGFQVKRILPNMEKKMVGPFIFLDHMGPADFDPGKGINVRPHPHIGLSTLTYLFKGSMLHRDSLGSVQEIHPGEVNWMTAGKGIVHSERETFEVRSVQHQADGLQFWVALPPEKAEIEPAFQHLKREQLPHRYLENTFMRLIAGEAYGMVSLVRSHWPMYLIDVLSQQGEVIQTPEHEENAVYIQQGSVNIAGTNYAAGDFVLLETGEELEVQEFSRLILLGGKEFKEKPHIRWNFVAWSRERLQEAEDAWRSGRFPQIPGDNLEFIPY